MLEVIILLYDAVWASDFVFVWFFFLGGVVIRVVVKFRDKVMVRVRIMVRLECVLLPGASFYWISLGTGPILWIHETNNNLQQNDGDRKA